MGITNFLPRSTSTETLAREAYVLAKDLGILSQELLEDFCSKEDLERIEKYEEQVRQVNSQLKAIREEQLGFLILDRAENKKRAFSIDWRWAVEDIVWNLKELIPELQVSLESKEEWDEENKRIKAVLNVAGDKVAKDIPFDNPYELVNFINRYLPEHYKEREFVEYSTGGDSYGFLLLEKNLVELAKSNKFIKIRNP